MECNEVQTFSVWENILKKKYEKNYRLVFKTIYLGNHITCYVLIYISERMKPIMIYFKNTLNSMLNFVQTNDKNSSTISSKAINVFVKRVGI